MTTGTTVMGIGRVSAIVAGGSALLLGWASLTAADGGLRVSDARIRLPPPGVKVHAGYLTISNAGATARQLVGVESGDYARVELHASQVTNGVATMTPVAQVEIAPGAAVRFTPGGLHLMLIGPKTAPPHRGDVSLTLEFDDGTRLPVSAAVRDDAAGHSRGQGPHRGHHHGH